MNWWLLLFVCFIVFLTPLAPKAEETYTFDLSEIEKKPYHIDGYVEVKPLIYQPRADSSLYQLKYPKQDLGRSLEEAIFKLQLEGTYESGNALLHFKTNTNYKLSRLGDRESTDLYEGYFSLKPSPAWQIDVGKKTFKWGKGYAWNPAAFLDRPKDPEDPELGMEGVFALSANYIKSFSGNLKTFSPSFVLQPIYDHINDEFGKKNYINAAAKLYFLFYDTDIDLMVLTGGSYTSRFGADFSRNLTPNWEIHGEIAFIRDSQKSIISPIGTVTSVERDTTNYLIGSRYLTERDTTYLIEYYHNDTGFTGDEMKEFFLFAYNAYRKYTETSNDTDLKKALQLFNGQYGRPSPTRDYLYLRISQKEPFDILYFTPAITTILNLNDRSFTISPEVSYTGLTNFDIRLKISMNSGSSESEYGEKPFAAKIELRIGYYF